MAKRRKAIPLATQVAALLLTQRYEDGSPVITHKEAKTLTAKQVRARFDLDHWPVAVWLGGTDHHSNLVFRPKIEHKKKTAKVDIPMAAKSKRIREQEASFRLRMLEPDMCAKADRQTKPRARPMPGSRNSDWKKPMRGKPVRR